MALSTKELWMDFHNQNITRLCVVQNEKDTRKYNIHFCDEGIPIQLNSSDYELYIAEKKADGNKVLKACTINNDGTGLLVFDENMCISNGSAALQFILRNKKDNSWTRTIAFNARIHEAVLNNGDITSSTEFDVLSNLILKVEELDKVINDNEKIRQANEEVRKSNEVKRIDAENERISNENTRKSNETQRVNAENTRVKQENDRKTSEEKRINAENTRVSNENTRKANETQRQTNETTRTNAETKRVNAETDRQSKETARQQNENTRETNETTRQSNEKTRVSNETTRTNAESERIKNENTRISNENTRQTQETKRQNDTATAITNANNAAKNANDKANDLQDKLDNNYFVLTNELENSVSSTSTTHAPTAKAVKTAYDKAVSVENTINSNKSNWNDKYTKNEIDNKFSTLESNIDWKESVATYADIIKTYPNPQDGWTVNVKDTDYTYRYSGSAWVVISANAIPKATQSVDGLLAKEDKINYDDANSKKHTHSNKSVLDGITSALIASWNKITDKLDKTGDASNTTTSFSTASTRSNISTGEKLAISLGKIAKWFSDLKNVAFTGSYNDLLDRPTVGNGTITIKQAGTNKGTFSMNQTGNTTIELSDNNTWRPVETLLTNQNLDAVVTPGFYNAGGGNTCANKPSGIDAFGLIVTHNAGGQYYTQMLFNNTGAISCRRYCISGTWGNWLEDKFTDTTYSNATTSTAGLMSPDDKTTLNNLKTGAVTGVKGNAETTYRTGGVNLTPANIGALPSNGNAVSASKLATTRNINGAKFDGTSDIQLPLYYSYSFGVTQNAIYYSSFCKMKKDNSTSECETTLLLSATGNFGGTVPGTYLISMSNRGQKATMTVICLQKSSQSDLTFGYYYDDTYFYFGVIRPTYSYSTNLTVLSKSASAETGKFLNSTTKPTNWVDVAITNSIGGDASTVNGHTVNADVPSNAKFTDTNTWRGIQNSLTSDSTTDSLSAIQGKILNDTKLLNKTLDSSKSNIDLDAINETGIYHILGRGTVSNVPVNGNGTLFVDKSVGTPNQIFYRDADLLIAYKRIYNSDAKKWGNWNKLSFSDTNTTYSNFIKSGTGAKSGLVPAPSTTAGTTKYLREDGTWQVPPNTNTTYSNGTGIGLSGTTFYNTGVRDVATGNTIGTINVNLNGTIKEIKPKGTDWTKVSGTNCTVYYNAYSVYVAISAQNITLNEYGGSAKNSTIVVLPTSVVPISSIYLGTISALKSDWTPLDKSVTCNINTNTQGLTLRPAEKLTNVILNYTGIFPRNLFTIK